jgi:tetratricopeptide (TPR) repeat protein
MAYARIGFEYAAQEYQPKLALPYLEHAVHLSQQLPPLNRLYIEAWSAMARSDADTAIGILRDITTQYPDETEAYRELSRLLRGQERVEEAATLLQVGIRKNPNAKELYDELGLILMVTKRPQEAIGVLKQYLALSPQNPNAHDSLGMAYQWAGQYEASETEFNQALQLDPEFEPSVAHLGDIYYHMGRYRDALVEYRHLLKIAVTSGDAKAVGFADISTVYRRMGDLTDAQTAATQEVRNNKTAVWESLVIALDKNDTEHARVLQRTLFSDPPNADRDSSRNLRMEFFYRGSIELRTGNPQQAVSDFKLALQHLPPSSGMDSHEDCLANAFLELGMFQDAITAYQSILNNNPRYPLGYYHLGISYYKAHDLQESKASFQRFLQANPSADQDSPAILEAKRILQSNAL